ncbi:MAG: hypothetical protein LBE34_10625 [Flavobacteriaceae bacterium]|jgi:hypothetical protein|nr:hypothetical protein [Flavobacteriaceae bacterium]
MKKTLILLGLLFSFSIGFAQDFATKKGFLLMDKKEIAKVSDKRRVYTFSDLNDQELIKIKQVVLTINSRSRKIYYEVSLPDNSKTIVTENNSGKHPLSSSQKMFIDFTIGQYKLLSENGINKEVIQKMFEDDHSALIAELKTYEDYQADANRQRKQFDNRNLGFDEQGNFGPTSGREVRAIGRIKRSNIEVNYDKYEVFDVSGKSVAVWNEEGDNYIVFKNGDRIYLSQSNSSPSSTLSMDSAASIICNYAINKFDLKP